MRYIFGTLGGTAIALGTNSMGIGCGIILCLASLDFIINDK